MEQYKIDFIKFLIKSEALKFGEFKLKSGRMAPYFLNVGSFYTGEKLTQLGDFYAQTLINSGIEVDAVFGPAYKGIPLSVIITSVLYSKYNKNISYDFNRKKLKDYGQKDNIIGSPLNENTKIMIVDDVITAGTAIRDTANFLKDYGNPKIAGILISLNRMEKNNEGENAIAQIEKELNTKIYSIINLDELIEILYNREIDGKIYIDDEKMNMINNYRKQYGV